MRLKKLLIVLKLIKNISNPYSDKVSAEQMQNEIDAIANLMNTNEEFRAGVPDMQEIFDFMVKLGQGYAGFMPSAENWKLTDIVTYKPSQDLKIKPGESPANAIANNFQAFISTALIEGGFSVKYGLGGASGGRERVMLTAYTKHEGFNTQQVLLKIMEIYNWSFQPEKTDTERVRSIEEIQSNEQQLDSLLERAKSNGIITDKEIEEIKKEGAHQAKLLEKKIRKKIPFQKNKKIGRAHV